MASSRRAARHASPGSAAARAAKRARFVDDDLASLLARASSAVAAPLQQAMRDAGLTDAEWRVLAALFDGERITITALAQVVKMKQPTVTKLVDRLEHASLVRRRASTADRRRTLVQIGPRGSTRVRALMPQARAQERALLTALGPGEGEALKRRLRALIDRCDRG